MTRSYYRIFHVLKSVNGGETQNNRTPQGRCVIEARGGTGRVQIYIQDLKPQVAYKCVLVRTAAQGNPVHAIVGIVEVGANRRADMHFEINPDNVGKSGFPIEEFDTVVIINNNGTVLSSGKTFKDLILDEPVQVPKPVHVPEPVHVPVPEPVHTPEPIYDAAQTPHEKVYQFIKIADYNELPGFEGSKNNEHAETPENRKEHQEEHQEHQEEHREEHQKEYNEDYHEVFNAAIERLNKEINELAEIAAMPDGHEGFEEPEEADGQLSSLNTLHSESENSPFEDDTAVWKEITPRELMLLPIDIFDHEQKAVTAASYYLHGNFIISNAPENSQASYTIGVPGVFSSDDSKGFKKLGFYTFRGKKGGAGAGAEGYWLKEI
jgi:hypothetical protein